MLRSTFLLDHQYVLLIWTLPRHKNAWDSCVPWAPYSLRFCCGDQFQLSSAQREDLLVHVIVKSSGGTRDFRHSGIQTLKCHHNTVFQVTLISSVLASFSSDNQQRVLLSYSSSNRPGRAVLHPSFNSLCVLKNPEFPVAKPVSSGPHLNPHEMGSVKEREKRWWTDKNNKF